MIRDLSYIAKDTNKFLKSYIKKQSKTELIRSMKYGLLPGGKKIRSKILIDVGKIFNLNYRSLIRVGAAVECIHAYSLIHDDLPCMDNDSIRRGKLSTHKKFGESTAVLAGNSLLTLAFEILSDKSLLLKENTKVKLINLISECSGHTGIAGGQELDLKFEIEKLCQTRENIIFKNSPWANPKAFKAWQPLQDHYDLYLRNEVYPIFANSFMTSLNNDAKVRGFHTFLQRFNEFSTNIISNHY